MAGNRDDSGEIGERLATLEQRFEAFDALAARVVRLEGIVAHMLAEAGLPSDEVTAVASNRSKPTIRSIDDPLGDPAWIEGPKGIYSYSIEMDCCQHCGIMTYLLPSDGKAEPKRERAIRPNGGKTYRYKDIGPSTFAIYRKEYMCTMPDCGKTSRQYIPQLGFSLLPRRRMTTRLFSYILDELFADPGRMTLEQLSKRANVSVETLGRWRKKYNDNLPRLFK